MAKSELNEWEFAMQNHNFKTAKQLAIEYYESKNSDTEAKIYYYDTVFYEKYSHETIQAGIDAIRNFYEENPAVKSKSSPSYCAYLMYKYATDTKETSFRPKWITTIAKYDDDVGILSKLDEWIDNVKWVSNERRLHMISIKTEINERLKKDKEVNDHTVAKCATILILMICVAVISITSQSVIR